ncbi:hypothetical protein JWG39_03645 [Desulforhopalus vacuolatus]|uniref:hypothetical protein n=1 Tax=Desulforhopalus vacuolatus TaxID=40414 RepID=UPI001965998A|nr:hypothetical protein [Desulforhopalus vacuolatus]MBM9518907.1 hypothetical protein [Desulforhopalus vacuolatus]
MLATSQFIQSSVLQIPLAPELERYAKKEIIMFKFSSSSEWSLENELRCFVIFKQLEAENFTRGMQSDLCREFESKSNLSFNTINAKVGNFKSESGVTGDSHVSEATKYLVAQYGSMSLPETKALLSGYLLCQKANT